MIDILSEDDKGEDEEEDEGSKLDRRSEIQSYKRYVDVTIFLASLRFPNDLTVILAGAGSIYDDIPEEYYHRLPLWRLLEDPWSYIDPIMEKLPEFSSKLAPLCTFLHLDKDDFFARLSICTYNFISITYSVIESKSVSTNPLINTVHHIIDNIQDPNQRIESWRCIFEKECDVHNDIAYEVLLIMIKEIKEYISRTSNREYDVSSLENQRSELLHELMRMNIRRELNKLISDVTPTSSIQKLYVYLGEPLTLMQHILDFVVEKSWLHQMQYLRSTRNVLCAYDVMVFARSSRMESYLVSVGEVLYNIEELCKDFLCSSSEPREINNAQKQPTNHLEHLRNTVISKLLSDVDYGVTGGNTVDAENNRNTGNNGAGGSKPGSSLMASMLWKGPSTLDAISSGESVISSTDSECRRREDVYRAFAISTLLTSCHDKAQR